MPFGTKQDAQGRPIDFDHLYSEVFQRAIREAGMEPLRADEERDGGLIHKPMFERLVLCPVALADLTTANANVFYELGVRHAVRPHTTVLAYEKSGQRLPFDVSPLRALPYEVDDEGRIVDPATVIEEIHDRLVAARDPAPDSPFYQLLDGIAPPDIARLKTDVFRDRVRYSQEVKDRLTQARRAGAAAVCAVHEELRPLVDREAGIVVDLLLSYRDVDDYEGMVNAVAEMGPPVKGSALVREQLGFALNRLGRSDEAETVLVGVIEEHGPSSETYGLLGRVHKDRWEQAREEGQDAAATAHLRKAIEAYRCGFEADWRDHYPGVNAVTLLAIAGEVNELGRLLPVVRYSLTRRLESSGADYWDWATGLELAVLDEDWEAARVCVGECLALNPPAWQRTTTVRNLRLLKDACLSEDGSAELEGILESFEESVWR